VIPLDPRTPAPRGGPPPGAPGSRLLALALALLVRVRGAGEALFALAVLAVVLLLVAPLPPALTEVEAVQPLAGSVTLTE
jgi:hypothetical protein